MGYSQYIKQNREAMMCLKMCAVLPLLPAYLIEQGFQEIKNHARNNAILLPRFFTYFSSFWLIRKGPECISVHGQPRRTNNNIESFHSTLKQKFQVMHPNLWKMLEHLKNMNTKQHIVIQQLAAGLKTTRSVKMKYILNSLRIKNAAALLSTGTITVKDFLLQCSHSTDRYLTMELNWNDEFENFEEEEEAAPIAVQNEIVVHNININNNANFEENVQQVIPVSVHENAAVNNVIESENFEIVVVEAIQQIPAGEEYDRCFVCLSGRSEVDESAVNILLPCGHGWCCDTCGQHQTNCGICKTPIEETFNIHIMTGNGQWINNLNSLLDPTGSNCLHCLRAFRDVPNGIRYVYRSCGHGWRCENYAIPHPHNCEVCNGTVEDIEQIFIC